MDSDRSSVPWFRVSAKSQVKPTPRAELRGEHPDPGAVPDLVDLVERVHDIEPQRGRLGRSGQVEVMGQAEIDLGVGRHGTGVGKAIAIIEAAEPRAVLVARFNQFARIEIL
jgi:hypothetical protein